MRQLLGIALLTVAGMTSASGDTRQEQQRQIVYEDAARTFRETIVGGAWEGGNIVPSKPAESQRRDIMFDEQLSYTVRDCSDETYRCIASSHQVFAVPRGGLSSTANYTAAGALFKVEECLRGDGHSCQVALISSDCQRSSSDGCLPMTGGRSASPDPGPFVYFIYNEDFGVTAFGIVKAPIGNRELRRSSAAHMILQSQGGLLSN